MYQNKGFTLIELLVVVLIIGILSAVTLPQYELAVYKSRVAAVRPLVHQLAEAQEIYYLANGSYARDLLDLDVEFPSSCTYEKHSDWAYNVLRCPAATIHSQWLYGAVTAYPLKCPVNAGGCVAYTVPLLVHSSFLGKGPNCYPFPTTSEKIKEFGEKVCLALGGKKEVTNWGDKYYF